MTKTLTVAGRELAIASVPVRDLQAFLAALEPVARELMAGDILPAIVRHTDAVITATAIGAGVERQWLEAQDAEALVLLAGAVIEVNADFFVQRLVPALTMAAQALAAASEMWATPSTAGSAPSSAMASPAPR